MKKVKFELCSSEQGPRVLPQWIHDQLDEFENNPPSEPYPPSRVEFIVKAIEDSGMDRIELAKRMQKEDGKTQITPDFIDSALDENRSDENNSGVICLDDRLESWLLMRFLKALNIKWEDYARIQSENDEKKSRIWDNDRKTLQALRKYRRYGPHLHALIRPLKSMLYHSRSDHQMLIKLAMMDDEESFDPPSAERVSYTISKKSKSFMSKTALKRFDIGGYRYHRLPNEIYDFDLEGNLLASGQANMETPPGLVAMEVKVPGRFIRTEKPHEIIAKIKQRNQTNGASKMK